MFLREIRGPGPSCLRHWCPKCPIVPWQWINLKIDHFFDAYVVHDKGPAFHRDALEHGQHRQAEVVEVGDASVRSYPVRVTDPPLLRRTFVAFAARPRRVQYDHVCIETAQRVVSMHKSTTERVQSDVNKLNWHGLVFDELTDG